MLSSELPAPSCSLKRMRSASFHGFVSSEETLAASRPRSPKSVSNHDLATLFEDVLTDERIARSSVSFGEFSAAAGEGVSLSKSQRRQVPPGIVGAFLAVTTPSEKVADVTVFGPPR